MYCMLQKRGSEERVGYFVKEEVAMNLLDKDVIVGESCLVIIAVKSVT